MHWLTSEKERIAIIEYDTGVRVSYGDLARIPHVFSSENGVITQTFYGDLAKVPHAISSEKGIVTELIGDFTASNVKKLLALIRSESIIVPISLANSVKDLGMMRKIAEIEQSAEDFCSSIVDLSISHHEFYEELRKRKTPGLVLFSSGSTGKPKAAVHDLGKILKKFNTPRQNLTHKTMLVFLMFDHIGGINTLFSGLSNGMTLVSIKNRNPDVVCSAIEKYKVNILPTTPTFLNMMLLHESCKHFDLSSLETITYGTEPMQASTLEAIAKVLPHVKLQQTYGLSELGILRTKSKANDSLWMKMGGEGFEWRVREGLLEIKAESAMLGYLNAPSPFTEDGWFRTGDAVEVDGEWLRVLGRQSEMINVGGEKVWPAEVESILSEIPNIEEVVVSGESHPLVGQVVKATVRLSNEEAALDFKRRMIEWCKNRLVPSYKIPQKVLIKKEVLHSSRMKKERLDANR